MLKRRIRSLLVVSRDPGATSAERETARSLADRLMAANGWTEADIPEREVERRAAPPPRTVRVYVHVGGFASAFNAGFASGFTNGTNDTTNGNW